ncbi:MAG: hypothetical protein HYY84_06350 [Deltaproteobacteria bacterium]|nr:hypothetical protein [Deltaproteobacteria bacterium]
MKANSLGMKCLVAAVAPVLACAGREAAWQSESRGAAISPAARAEAAQLERRADELWRDRLDRSRLEAAIATLARAVEIDATNATRLTRLARAYYFLADGHLSFELERAKREDESGESAAIKSIKRRLRATYQHGANAAERAIAAHAPRFATAMRSGARLESALHLVADKSAAGALFWYAANLGRWALLMGIAEILYHKDRVFAVVERVQSLAPDFFHGAVDRYFGVYYTRVPVPRGDLARSKRHFERALRRHPSYLATRVLFAEHYAVRARDRALFERELRAVTAADERALPNLLPELTVEKRRARLLLERVEDLF